MPKLQRGEWPAQAAWPRGGDRFRVSSTGPGGPVRTPHSPPLPEPLCPAVPPPLLTCPLLTCSPTRRPAATPWWTAPSAPTGLRSLVGSSGGDSHTTAAGQGEGVCQAPALCATPPRIGAQPRGAEEAGGGGQALLRALGSMVGGPDRGKEGGRVLSYHLYPNVGGEGLLSLVLGVQTQV